MNRPTHHITNQPPPLFGDDARPGLLTDYAPLTHALSLGGAQWALPELAHLGDLASGRQAQEWAWQVERNPPVLHTHDRYGHRIDEVQFDPAWHSLMTTAVGHGLHAAPWAEQRTGVHVARAAKNYVWAATDPGHLCPISMTYAVVPALRAHHELSSIYEPLLTSPTYEPQLRTPSDKAGVIAGMSMTEKQGGSDVRANTTQALPNAEGTYSVTGHKWFTSAPMSDFFLTLAQAPRGLSCFFVPRVLPDGTRNAIALQRLKDKLGNRSNASAEIEYDAALGWLVGEEGRGVATIVEMVNMTRLDCVIGSAASMRLGTLQATHHARHRRAFGKALIDQPLMRNVLADLALEAEAATITALRMASAVDRAAQGDDHEAAFRRFGLAVSKYWICKRSPLHAAEALECLGGNGFVEDSGMPRLYREAPLMSIWEGSGNVAALDTLRALGRQPESLAAFFHEIEDAASCDHRVRDTMRQVEKELAEPETIEFRARAIVEKMALLLQASLMVQQSPAPVAEAFIATRLGAEWGAVFGTLPAGINTAAIIERV